MSEPATMRKNKIQDNIHDNDDDDDFLTLPTRKALQAKFPPGCPVLVVSQQQFWPGTVFEVGIDWKDRRETLYKVQSQEQDIIIVPEKDIAWGEGCPVWFREGQAAVVVGWQKRPPAQSQKDVLCYSVQLQSGNCTIFHGVSANQIQYRLVPSETDKENRENTNNGKGKATIRQKEEPLNQMDREQGESKMISSLEETGQTIAKEGHQQATPQAGENGRKSSSAETVVRPDEVASMVTTETSTEVSRDTFSGLESIAGPNNDNAGRSVPVPVKTEPMDCSDGAGKSKANAITPNKKNMGEDQVGRAAHHQKGDRPNLLTPSPKPSAAAEGEPKRTAATPFNERWCPPILTSPTPNNNPITWVTNPHPNPFQFIQKTSGHQFKKALAQLREHRRQRGDTVGTVVFHRCLKWHLEGTCHANCLRKTDHNPLPLQTAKELERALWPVMSPQGPILARTPVRR